MTRPRARLLLSAVLVLLVGAPARANDDGKLRGHIRDAGLVPYFSFKPVTSFDYPDIATGRPLALADFRGRVVLVNVWATWCPPCVKEMPSLQLLHEEFQSRGLVVLGVNVRDKKGTTAVSQWLAQRKLTFVNVKATDDGPKFPSGFTIPQTFLIDRDGRLLANKPGSRDWAAPDIKTLLERLLETGKAS